MNCLQKCGDKEQVVQANVLNLVENAKTETLRLKAKETFDKLYSDKEKEVELESKPAKTDSSRKEEKSKQQYQSVGPSP